MYFVLDLLLLVLGLILLLI